MINFTIKCKECGEFVANSNNVLSRHLKKHHKINWIDYVVKWEHENVWPMCACDCGEKLPFHRGRRHFYLYSHPRLGKKSKREDEESVDLKFFCYLCDRKFERETSLIRHLSRKHSVRPKDYSIHKSGGIIPTCECGCGRELTFHKNKFRRFVQGHASKVPEIRQRMIDEGRKAAADPEKRKKNSDTIISLWKNQEYRDKLSGSENLSEKEIKNLERIHSDPMAREKMSKSKSEMWEGEWGKKQRELMSSPEFRKKVSLATKKAFIDDPSIGENISLKVRQSFRDGRRIPQTNYSNIRSEWKFNPFTDQEEWMDSGWESRFLDECVKKDIPTTKDHKIMIEYENSIGKNATYFPDFLLLDHDILVEVKGQILPDDDLKWNGAKMWCEKNETRFIVLRESDFEKFFEDVDEENRR